MMPVRIKLKTSKGLTGVKAAASKPKKPRPKQVHPDREGQFRKLWDAFTKGHSVPQFQYMFDAVRKWRFDFAWPDHRVAVEIDGGVYQRRATGHRSISGVVNQMEKLNAAAIQGWIVLRFHANDLDKNPANTIEMVLKAINNRPREGEAPAEPSSSDKVQP